MFKRIAVLVTAVLMPLAIVVPAHAAAPTGVLSAKLTPFTATVRVVCESDPPQNIYVSSANWVGVSSITCTGHPQRVVVPLSPSAGEVGDITSFSVVVLAEVSGYSVERNFFDQVIRR